MQTSLIHLGLTASGALQVPPTTAVAGWYTGSPRPGAVGSAVIAGHIDSHAGPGIFFRLSSLRPGDRVYVRRADGTLAVFRVTVVRQFPKDSFPTSAVYGAAPDAELRLITCGGTFDPQLALVPEQHGRLRGRDQLTRETGATSAAAARRFTQRRHMSPRAVVGDSMQSAT